MRNAELKDRILKENRAVSGIAPQAGAGKGSANPAVHDWRSLLSCFCPPFLIGM